MTIMSRSGAKFWWGVDLPKEVAFLYYEIPCMVVGLGYKPGWKEKTYKEILDKKRENQRWELKRKRHCQVTKPCFIWVFFNNSFFFGGWWIYIKTLHKDYGINFRHEHDDRIIVRAMELFNCGVIPFKENFEPWAVEFSKTYPHVGFNRKRKQGLVKCFAQIDEGGRLVNLLSKNHASIC